MINNIYSEKRLSSIFTPLVSIIRGFFILFISLSITNCGASGGGGSDSSSQSQDIGIAGSMARFAIVGDYLYAIGGSDLQLFDISDPSSPALWSKVSIGFGIETLFPYNDYLFIGSETGLFIYDNTNPMFPEYVSEFEHARSCDPVVVQGDYAYVTLRSNSSCLGLSNQLDIVDISDIVNPELVSSYPMQEPKGLAIDNEKLFLCDGDSGLKVFDVSLPTDIVLLDFIPAAACYDLIADSELLVVSGDTALFQYDYNQVPIMQLSTISIAE